MSQTCQHNTHTHFFLYFLVYCTFMSSCLDCSGERSKIFNLESQLHQLEYKVNQLQSK